MLRQLKQKTLAILLLCLVMVSHGSLAKRSQSDPPYVEGQILVRFAPQVSQSEAKAILNGRNYEIVQNVVPQLNLYLVKLKHGMNVERAMDMMSLRKEEDDGILYAQPDHLVKLRETIPRVTHFSHQWSLDNPKTKADIRALQAWDLSTGGKDRDGNDIVVAVVDGGADLSHPNLVPNIWVNRNEIPNNGVDDDGNGYIDDINGWNSYDINGKVAKQPHGTHVAGIVGASGGASLPIVGVNWNVKIMVVSGASTRTSLVLASYAYVLKQKTLWLESHGRKGANVVVTNSSFGVDGADCKAPEYAAWNDMYDAMGKVGILSAAATANLTIDIDEAGDVPTGCKSQYLIRVTNTDNEDKKYEHAGYGLKSVDIGAPGTKILSTLPDNKYGFLTGTSMATPHVAGAVAFLYSVPNWDFDQLAKRDPSAASLLVKKLILEGVDKIDALKGITSTGGRLNLARSALDMFMYRDIFRTSRAF